MLTSTKEHDNQLFWYWLGQQMSRAVARAFFNLRVMDQHNLIEDGPVLIVCNHQSYLDPPMVGAIYHDPIYYLARKTLFRGFGAFLYPRLRCIPVDQENPEPNSLRKIVQLLNSGEKVLMFPEGARSQDGELLPASAGIGLILNKAKVPVQPLRIFGANEALKPGTAKVNLQQITLTVGEALRFDGPQYKGREGYQRIADEIMQAIGNLKQF